MCHKYLAAVTRNFDGRLDTTTQCTIDSLSLTEGVNVWLFMCPAVDYRPIRAYALCTQSAVTSSN